MANSKLSLKFFKTIFFISIFVLATSSLIAFYIMGNIERNTQEQIKNSIDIKLQNKINSSFKIGVTNAVSIASNNQLIESLKQNNKNKAYNILNKLEKNYHNLASQKETKIHIHTADVKSFMRSWDKNHNGDELSSFRHTINKVKDTNKTVLNIEIGWADLVIRAIVPIIQNNKYLGSLEFLQDFNEIQKSLENEKKYLLTLIDIKLLKNKAKSDQIIDKYALVQREFNNNFF
ncbi:MAG: cache domain-containing protein [Campylobacterota bacterium]|nr:cache domain-containing protein [Campylobacterota bacterium]